MSIEGNPNNLEDVETEDQESDQTERPGDLKEVTDSALEKLRVFEEERRKILFKLRKLKRDWEEAGSEVRGEIRSEMSKLADQFREMKEHRDKVEDELFEFEKNYQNSPSDNR